MTALNELHQMYDSAIPAPVLAVARYGSPEMVAFLKAVGQRAFYRSMIAGQIKAIRVRRADGSFYPSLLSDLAMYRRQFSAWNKIAHEMRRKVDAAAVPAPSTLAA